MNTKLTIRVALLMGMAMGVHSSSYADAAGEGIKDPRLKAMYQRYERLRDEATNPGVKQAIEGRLKSILEMDKNPNANVRPNRNDNITHPQKDKNPNADERPVGVAFKGICGLELGSEMDVSKLKFKAVMNYHGEIVSSKAFHGKVVPPKPIKGLTSYEVFVTAKTHRLFMIKAYTDDWAIFKNPMFMFKYKVNWAPTPNEILEDPGIVKATEKKYSKVADRSGDRKFFRRDEFGYYQWMLKFGSRIEGFCFDPVKTDTDLDDAVHPVVMLAIDTELEKEARAEGESYEKDKELNDLKAGAAAADEAADAL